MTQPTNHITIHDDLTKYISTGIQLDRIVSSLTDTVKTKICRIAHFINTLLDGKPEWCNNEHVFKIISNNFLAFKSIDHCQAPSCAELTNAEIELTRIMSATEKLYYANFHNTLTYTSLDTIITLNNDVQLSLYKIKMEKKKHLKNCYNPNYHLLDIPTSASSSNLLSKKWIYDQVTHFFQTAIENFKL